MAPNFIAIQRLRSDEEVGEWLESIGFEMYIKDFKYHAIRGDVFPLLNRSMLQEIGVSSIGDRVKLLHAIEELGGISEPDWQEPSSNSSKILGNLSFTEMHDDRILSPIPVASDPIDQYFQETQKTFMDRKVSKNQSDQWDFQNDNATSTKPRKTRAFQVPTPVSASAPEWFVSPRDLRKVIARVNNLERQLRKLLLVYKEDQPLPTPSVEYDSLNIRGREFRPSVSTAPDTHHRTDRSHDTEQLNSTHNGPVNNNKEAEEKPRQRHNTAHLISPLEPQHHRPGRHDRRDPDLLETPDDVDIQFDNNQNPRKHDLDKNSHASNPISSVANESSQVSVPERLFQRIADGSTTLEVMASTIKEQKLSGDVSQYRLYLVWNPIENGKRYNNIYKLQDFERPLKVLHRLTEQSEKPGFMVVHIKPGSRLEGKN